MKTHLNSHFNCFYHLKYHLVLVTKYRKKCFTHEMLNYLEELCQSTCELWDVKIEEFKGEADHVQLVLSMHPNLMPSKFINNLKTVTSRLMRKEYAEHLKKIYCQPVLWTRAYCLLTVGDISLEKIEEYIQKQEKLE
jgi:putative transposase